jgi:sec-independent protein translocase protein TatC
MDTDKSELMQKTFWEHLNELRWILLRSVVVILFLSIIAFIFKDIIFDQIIFAPKNADFITNRFFCRMADWLSIKDLCFENAHIKLINTNLSGQFMTHMYVSAISGLIAGSPYLIWELWRFIKPALYEKERKQTRGAVLVITLLFWTGILFSYYVIVPLMVNFLGTYQVSANVENLINLNSYISSVTSMVFSVGVVFELPVIVYVLAKVGLITGSFMKKNRKYAIVIILIVAAIITPSTDMFSQLLVSLPLYILYEVSIGIAKRASSPNKAIENNFKVE